MKVTLKALLTFVRINHNSQQLQVAGKKLGMPRRELHIDPSSSAGMRDALNESFYLSNVIDCANKTLIGEIPSDDAGGGLLVSDRGHGP